MATKNIARTGIAGVDGLLSGVAWSASTLTFSFPTNKSQYGGGYGQGEPGRNFEAFNAAQQGAARAALDMMADVCGLSFSEMTETDSRHATLRFAESDAPDTAWGYLPNAAPEGGDMWFNRSSRYFDEPVAGDYAWITILHELGHALGLKHPHERGGLGTMPSSVDSMEFSVMSYRSYVGASTTGGYTNKPGDYAQTLMMYDIAAMQHMYGADYGTRSGNTTYSWNPDTGAWTVDGRLELRPGANTVFMTVWDGDGRDTYDFSAYESDLTVDLRPGRWTSTSREQLADLHYSGSQVARGNIANALLHEGDTRSLIENATCGSGDDWVCGNQAANVLRGNAGDDTLLGERGGDQLRGGIGNDRLTGGRGQDKLFGGDGADTFIFAGGSGTDTIIDFKDDIDTIQLRSASLDIARGTDVLTLAKVTGGDTVFTFDTGDKLIVRNVTDIDLLRNDIEFF